MSSTVLPSNSSDVGHRSAIAELSSLSRSAIDLEVIIPAYNEEQRLPRTILRTARLLAERPWNSRIVVVDNGSVDATPAIGSVRGDEAFGVPLHVMGCAEPGKGAAVRRGMLTSRATYVGYMDADLATPVEALDGVMSSFASGADVVVGSRRAPGAGYAVPPTTTRRLGTTLFSGIGRQLAPGVADTQCGFKFFRGEIAYRVLERCTTNGFAFDLELLALALRDGCDVRELPVYWTAQPGSTFRVVRDGIPSFASALRLLSSMGRTPARTVAHA